jgi:hypothetical protein
MHLAHLMPAPLGSDEPSNLQSMCPSCHARFDAGRRSDKKTRTRGDSATTPVVQSETRFVVMRSMFDDDFPNPAA